MSDMIKYNAKLFSTFGQNASVFGNALLTLHDKYNVKVLSSDMSVGAGLSKFKSTYPQDFFNVGIAEQNLIGVASGMASEGMKCIAVAQACFISMRSFEQVRQYLGYMKFPVIIVGINSGFALTYFGNTHYAIEDIALMRSIPGMTILSPADAGEAVKAVDTALQISGPVYLRLSGTTNNPVVYPDNFEYDYTKSNIVFDCGNDVTIFATGAMVFNSVKAAEMLKEENVNAKVVDVHCIKPLDMDAIANAMTSKLLVTVEEHSIIGGLGAGVAESISSIGGFNRLIRLGVNDCFSSVGDYNYLIEQHGLAPDAIKDRIIKELH